MKKYRFHRVGDKDMHRETHYEWRRRECAFWNSGASL